MPDTFTGNLGLTLPEVGASRNSWGSKLNTDLQSVDAHIYARMPPGAMCDFAGPTVPNGWLPCDGRAISRVDYAALFAAIGGYWGAGDGSTTFNLPDLRGYLTLGVGNAADSGGQLRGLSLGQKFGLWWASLSQSNLPNFKLNMTTNGEHQHTGTADVQGDHTHTGSTDVQGVHSHEVPLRSVPSVVDGGGAASLPDGGGSILMGTTAAGGHSHNISTTLNGGHAHNIATLAGQGGHVHDVFLNGGGLNHENTQPSAGVVKMIFTGRVTLAAIRDAPVPGMTAPADDASGHTG
jgi:microcystin-dependent protein